MCSSAAAPALVWDAANNLTATVDHRDGAEWPAGFRPQTTYISHDALYRVVGADFEYTQASGARTMNDVGTDWRDNYAQAPSVDPMRQASAPAVVDVEGMGRVESLRWSWDYLANTTSWTDNDDAFYERSIGAIGNGNAAGESSGSRPSALYVASNLTAGVTGSSNGWVEVDYGVGGNVTGMTVHAQCANGASACVDPEGDSDARRAALRSNCDCATEQHYAYRWDELNRLAEARRYDYDGIAWVRKVRQRYRYDGANSRTVKQTLESGSTPEAIALYPYPGDFERRGLTRGLTAYEASTTLETETQYVVAGARMVWKHGGAGAGYDRENRLAVPIGDLIQTTGAVFDVRSGELLEVSTYYPNGARETYLNDDTARAAPEVTGFTGKEADEEVGVVYFGERYLIPRLGRWASPDPLHVHASGGGEALNSYHYVSGNLLAARDPLGLNPREEMSVYFLSQEGSYWDDMKPQLERSGWFVSENESPSRTEMLDALREGGTGDMVVFDGHGNTTNIQFDATWFESGSRTALDASNLIGAIQEGDEAPSVVVLSSCWSATQPSRGDTLISQLADAGVGVVFGWDGDVRPGVARRVAAELVERLAAGDSIEEAYEAANRYSGGLGNRALLHYALGDGVRASRSLEENGLTISNPVTPASRRSAGGCSVSAPGMVLRCAPSGTG